MARTRTRRRSGWCWRSRDSLRSNRYRRPTWTARCSRRFTNRTGLRDMAGPPATSDLAPKRSRASGPARRQTSRAERAARPLDLALELLAQQRLKLLRLLRRQHRLPPFVAVAADRLLRLLRLRGGAVRTTEAEPILLGQHARQ